MRSYLLTFLCFVCLSLSGKHDVCQMHRAILLEKYGIETLEGNAVTLLPSGEEKFRDMFQHLRQARRYIHLEYFKFKNDSIGTALFDILKQKAREGVKVRFVFDGYATRSITDKSLAPFFAEARQCGVEIAEFDRPRFPWINHAYHRDHRKIVVIDGETAYTGGMNVADYYIHGTPKVGVWRDMHLRINGPAVGPLEHIFAVMWHATTGELLVQDSRYPVSQVEHGSSPIAVVDRYPLEGSSAMRKTLAEAIRLAHHSIQIVNPYPTNVRTVRKALKDALKRGVKVEIMVSSKCDNNFTPDVIGVEMKKLARLGAKVWYYDGGFHHSKVMTIDHQLASVGTTNLDARSLLFDYEVNTFIYDEEVTRQLEEIFARDRDSQCTLFTEKDWKSRFSGKHRVIGRLGSVLKGFL